MTRVLIIDDEPLYHKMIARALESQGYQMDFAENGQGGLAMARKLQPDLIITDVIMPDISGYEVTRLLRREAQFAQIPILVLTAQTGLQDKLKSFEVGADDHLTKPFEPAELVARIAALLRRAETVQTSGPIHETKEKARMIAVHSLRGGIGCSSLAVNLAIGMESLWKTPTLLLDLTMMAGQVALMLNMTLKRTWADVARYKPTELDIDVLQSIISKHDSGLAFIAAPTYPTQAETLGSETLSAALRMLSKHYDYMFMDLPHDFSDIAVQSLDVADIILLMISSDMASIRAATAVLDTYSKLNYPPEKVLLVLNATFPKHGLPKEKIEAALAVPIKVIIPYTPDLFVEAINYGQPLVSNKPDEPIAGVFEDFAFHLSKDIQRKSQPTSPSDAWKRVYKRYSERRK